MKKDGFELCKWASNSVEFVVKLKDENINCRDPSNELNHARKVLSINCGLKAFIFTII